MSNETAREIIAKTIVDLEEELEGADKELTAVSRKYDRIQARIKEIRSELAGLKSALETLGGPLPAPELVEVEV